MYLYLCAYVIFVCHMLTYTTYTHAHTTHTCIAAVSLKLPPFWPVNPAVWFLQVEAQFTLKGIVQQRTKFDHVIAVLTPEVATEVRDLILNPPGDAPYNLLKAALFKWTEASEQHKLQQLLKAEEPGDRKPSQLLQCTQELLWDASPPPEGTCICPSVVLSEYATLCQDGVGFSLHHADSTQVGTDGRQNTRSG